MALARIYQKPAGTPANGSVFAIEVLQNNIWYTRKVSWEALKGLIAGAESLVLDDGKLMFTTPDGVAHEVLTVEDEVLAGSDNPVSSGAVSSALDRKQDVLTFDQVPTDGSTNPVESNGVYDALAGKQDTLTFDTAPTDGSTNPVTSAGIYAAISAVTTGLDWKDSVATYADIATTYPNPQDGWTVTTLDDDRTYRYNGTAWVDLFSLIALATAQKDGLMSSTDFSKLAGIEAQANRTIVSDTLAPSTTTKKLATVSGGGTSKDILGDDADAILRAAFGEHTASGNPVSVDAFLGLEVVSECKVTMNPIQDLNGYDHPWVGGAGKNKVPSIEQGAIDTSGAETTQNNRTRTGWCKATAGTTYTASVVSGVYISTVNFYDSNKTYLDRIAYTGAQSSSVVTFDSIANTEYIRIVYRSATSSTTEITPEETANAQLEAGSTATSYEPYSNICPISGRTEASVTRTGKNLIDTIEQGAISEGGVETTNANRTRTEFIEVKGGTTYTSSVGSGLINSVAQYYTASKTNISRDTNSTGQVFSFTTPANASYVRLVFRRTNASDAITPEDTKNAMLELGNTPTPYEPYVTPETHTHQYGQTVYGGEDDFVNGEGKSEWGHIASYNGETLPGEWISDRDVYAPDTSPTTGAEVVYKLATAEQITHTPEDITLLKGVNDVSTDGDSLELKYSADIKAYIDSKLIT